MAFRAAGRTPVVPSRFRVAHQLADQGAEDAVRLRHFREAEVAGDSIDVTSADKVRAFVAHI